MCSRLAERELRHRRVQQPATPSIRQSRSRCRSLTNLLSIKRSGSCSHGNSSKNDGSGDGGFHFGWALRDQPQALAAEVGGPVPSLLAAACRFLSAEPSLSSEGLFRVEGARPRLLLLRARLDADRSCDFPTETPPRDVSSTLKAWLRQLPEPLLTVSVVEALARAADQGGDEAAKVRAVRAAAEAGSDCQARSLRLLCLLLHRLAAKDGGFHGNRMDANSLATCVGPCLYGGVDSAEAAARLNLGVALLIRRAADIPDVTADTGSLEVAAETPSQSDANNRLRQRSVSRIRDAVVRAVTRFSRRRRNPQPSRSRSRSFTSPRQPLKISAVKRERSGTPLVSIS